MTFDERMEALAARHEALTMNLELISHQIEDHNKQIERNSKQIEAHSKQPAIDAEHVRALVRIVEIHEQRLSEGGSDLSRRQPKIPANDGLGTTATISPKPPSQSFRSDR